MSYDIRLGVKVENTDIIATVAEPFLSSPTYNLGQMFRACTGWDFKQGEWYKVKDVYENILNGISELRINREKYVCLNPENGWGNIDGANDVLKSMRDCIDAITDPNCGYYWNVIPIEYLYITW